MESACFGVPAAGNFVTINLITSPAINSPGTIVHEGSAAVIAVSAVQITQDSLGDLILLLHRVERLIADAQDRGADVAAARTALRATNEQVALDKPRSGIVRETLRELGVFARDIGSRLIADAIASQIRILGG